MRVTRPLTLQAWVSSPRAAPHSPSAVPSIEPTLGFELQPDGGAEQRRLDRAATGAAAGPAPTGFEEPSRWVLRGVL